MIFIVERKCYYSYSQLVPFPMYSLSTQNQEPDLQTSDYVCGCICGLLAFFFLSWAFKTQINNSMIQIEIYISVYDYTEVDFLLSFNTMKSRAYFHADSNFSHVQKGTTLSGVVKFLQSLYSYPFQNLNFHLNYVNSDSRGATEESSSQKLFHLIQSCLQGHSSTRTRYSTQSSLNLVTENTSAVNESFKCQ